MPCSAGQVGIAGIWLDPRLCELGEPSWESHSSSRLRKPGQSSPETLLVNHPPSIARCPWSPGLEMPPCTLSYYMLKKKQTWFFVSFEYRPIIIKSWGGKVLFVLQTYFSKLRRYNGFRSPNSSGHGTYLDLPRPSLDGWEDQTQSHGSRDQLSPEVDGAFPFLGHKSHGTQNEMLAAVP